MIIKREYVYFWKLFNDDAEAKEIFLNALNVVADVNERDRIVEYNMQSRICDLDMGCGIPGAALNDIITRFNALDEEQPYDNGFDIDDVTDVVCVHSEAGKLALIFVKEFDGWRHIVKSVELSQEEFDKLRPTDIPYKITSL